MSCIHVESLNSLRYLVKTGAQGPRSIKAFYFIYFFKLELSVACGCILSDFVSFLLFWRSGCQTLPWCQSWKRCEHYCNPVDHPDWRPGMLTLYPSQCIQCQQNILYALSLVHSTEMTICIRSVLKNPVHTGLIPTQEPVGFYVEKIYRNGFFSQ